MGIGNRKPVQVEAYKSEQNASGSNIEAVQYRANTWAEVDNPSGFRAYQNGQTQLGSTKSFLIRFRFDRFPDCNWRIKYNNKLWTVTEIQRVDEKKFYYRLTASAKSDD